jgi:protoheme IX farnesyltransferase
MNETRPLTPGTLAPALSWREVLLGVGNWLKMLVVLFKLRVVFLLLMAALGGALLGAAGRPEGGALVLLLVTGMLSAGGASAINQYLERERDTHMARTRTRPLASGQALHPGWALAAGIAMLALAVGLGVIYNPGLAFFTALGAVIYVGIYTLWLKPRTVLNIVIGGAAGSCTVLSGGAAVGAWNQPGVLALALLIFVWTPVHFWSLAMAYRDDYAQAGFPMLPVNVTPRQAAGWVALHSLATAFAALALATQVAAVWAYLLPVVAVTIRLGALTLRLMRQPERKNALNLFIFSNLYLGIVLIALMTLSLWR